MEMDEEKARLEIGKKLKHLREIHNLSQEDMAQILEIPRSAVSLIESGDRGVDVMELAQYANHFHKKSDDLLAPVLKRKSNNNNIESKFNRVHFSTAAEMPQPAVQQAEAPMLPPISAVVNACNVMGLGMATTHTSSEPVLKSQAHAGSMCKATFNILLPLTTDENIHKLQYLVDTLHDQYPGCQPCINTHVNGNTGCHALSLFTMGE